MTTAVATYRAGDLLREWRQRRNLSQLALASRSAVSTRHLSFIETGRSRPSREMLLHLARRLEIPLRDRNRLLLAAGFAPVFSEGSLDAPQMGAVREALDRFLAAHEPYPALVLDPLGNAVAANRGVQVFVDGVAPSLLEPPVNTFRVTMDPAGMAPFIENFPEWTGHLLRRVQRDIAVSGDRELEALYEELVTYPGVSREEIEREREPAGEILATLKLRRDGQLLTFFSTLTTFGTPLDVTLADLTIEAFYPADGETAAVLAVLASQEA
jgi:transcriptional regulator with XRE-family HTH domain